jgi:nucleoside-diphosphate kinase
MLKPDAIERGLEEKIFSYFEKYGLKIEEKFEEIATAEQLEEHYYEVFQKYDDEFKKRMFEYFIGKKVVPMIVSGDNAVEEGRKMIGATNPAVAEKGTIRGDLSDDSYDKAGAEKRALHNLIHASDSDENAKREAKIWFGREF